MLVRYKHIRVTLKLPRKNKNLLRNLSTPVTPPARQSFLISLDFVRSCFLIAVKHYKPYMNAYVGRVILLSCSHFYHTVLSLLSTPGIVSMGFRYHVITKRHCKEMIHITSHTTLIVLTHFTVTF